MTVDVHFLCRARQRKEWAAVIELYGYKLYSEARNRWRGFKKYGSVSSNRGA
jgi:hypothetical protein